MLKIYHEKDADLKYLKNKTIAILGYGSQGHAQAQNLRESGLNVIVSELKGSKQWKEAKKQGVSDFLIKPFSILELEEAVLRAVDITEHKEVV